MKLNNYLLITAGIIIIILLCICIWAMGNATSREDPVAYKPSDNLSHEIQSLQSQFGISKWELNSEKNEIVIYVYDIQEEEEIRELQRKRVENLTIKAIHDTDFENTRAEVTEYLSRLRRNNPDYQIARISMVTDAFGDPPGNYAELWVYNSTPENQKLDGTVIQGWTIQIYPMAPLPAES